MNRTNLIFEIWLGFLCVNGSVEHSRKLRGICCKKWNQITDFYTKFSNTGNKSDNVKGLNQTIIFKYNKKIYNV